jgi:proliferating cell nuclear antigen
MADNCCPAMFKAKFKEAAIIKKILDLIKDLVTDCNLICGDDGICIQSMDSSHAVLITLSLFADGFLTYECTEDIRIGLNLTVLSKIIKCAENTDSITIESDAEKDSVYLTIESQNGNRRSTFELRKIDIESDYIDIPETEYACSLKMPCSQFQKVIRDLSSLGDTCSIRIRQDDVSFGTIGELGNVSIILQQDRTCKKEMDQTIIDTTKTDTDVKMMFSLRHLGHFAKSGISDQVEIYMTGDMPLHISYDLQDIGSIGFYLAPKIMDD